MKTLSLSLTAMLLLGLTTVTFAQQEDERQRRSDFVLQMQENDLKASYRAALYGNSLDNIMPWLANDYIRDGLGISEEQFQTIQDIRVDQRLAIVQDDPDYKAIKEAIDEVYSDIHNGTEEAQQQFFDLKRKQKEIEIETLEALIKIHLTADQIKNIEEFQMSTMSDKSFVSPKMFEALDLSDEQRKQLDAIKQKMVAEFENHIDRQAVIGMFDVKIRSEIARKLELEYPIDLEERQKHWAGLLKEAEPKRLQATQELIASGKELADKLKVEMFDVLTDEQWNRMVQLIDNPPEFVKAHLKRMREARGESEKAAVWAPGPNSWRPGDPIPEGYREQRQERRRFPRVEQSE